LVNGCQRKVEFSFGSGPNQEQHRAQRGGSGNSQIAGKAALAFVCMEVPPPGVYIALKAVVQIRNGNYRNLEILMFVRLEIGKT
jgi:hypothetical protein